ncbi:MAG: hypothetical protein AAF663_13005 [Planctomycetota bacterium]
MTRVVFSVTGLAAVWIASASAEPVLRPTGPSPEYQLISAAYPTFDEGGAVVNADRLRITLDGDEATGETAELVLVIDAIDADGPEPVLRTRVESLRLLPGMQPRYVIGQRIDLRVGFDAFDRLRLTPTDDAVQLGRNEPSWFGVRPPAGWPEYAEIPEDAGALGILGPWASCERWPVLLTDDTLRFGTDNWQAAEYLLQDWQVGQRATRIMAFYVEGYDERQLDLPVKLLMRRDGDRISVARFPWDAGMADAWPSSFTYSKEHPVQVFTFALQN